MKVKLLTTLALALPLMATTSPAALAASEEAPIKADKSSDAMQSKQNDKNADEAKKMDSAVNEAETKASESDAASAIDYVTRQRSTDWSAQALIGRDVHNSQGEDLGEINNVIINENGNVVAVTIGVGGFLGLGEKDVGVPFDALEFKTAKAADEMRDGDDTPDERSSSQDETSDESSWTESERFEREHADTQVVLNATRNQLKSASEFKWLDEQDDRRSEVDGLTSTR